MAATSSISSDNIELRSILPFSKEPIKKIPNYLFENFNYDQNGLSYKPDFLIKLKEKVKEIILSKITSLDIEDRKKVERAKEFDWIFALDHVEKDFLAKTELLLTTLKIEHIVQINSYLSRLTSGEKIRDEKNKDPLPGEFRKEIYRSSKHGINAVEIVAFAFIEKEIHKEIRKIQKDSSQPISDPSTILKELKMNKRWLENILLDIRKKQSKNKNILFAQFSFKSIKDLVSSWADSRNQIDLIKWIKDRMYFAPAPLEITTELQKSLDSIKDPKMHPIEKATKLFFDIVRMQVFSSENLQTARIIGYAILLSYGYLPPVIIGKETYKEYLACIDRGIEDGENPIFLTNFLAKQILQTQNKFKSDSSDISFLR